MQGVVQVSQVKQFYAWEEQPKTDHIRQSLKDKSTGDVPKNSHKNQTISCRATDSTLTSKEESYDNKNHRLTLIEKKR